MSLPAMISSYSAGSLEETTANETRTSSPHLTTHNENGIKPKVTRRSVACKSCHSLKVKCTPSDIHDPSRPCIRCLNANRKCEIDLNQSRKRRKKSELLEARSEQIFSTDSQSEVSRLRKQVKDLKAQLQLQQLQLLQPLLQILPHLFLQMQNHQHQNQLQHESPLLENSEPYVSKVDLEREIALLSNPEVTLSSLTDSLKLIADQRTFLINSDRGDIDMISHGLITLEEAEHRLHLYRTKIYATHRILEIPEETTVQELRKNQPFLFNSIMSIVNKLEIPDSDVERSLRIDNYAIQSIAIEVMVVGTKSIELVKAVLLLCLWYNTPELFRNRRYHLLNTIAVTMLHDLGIINRPVLNFRNDDGIFLENENNKQISLEYQSLILILYSTTVSICLMLRRTIYVKWTPFIESCCVNLELSNIARWQELAVFLRLSNLLDKIHQVVHSAEFAERPSTGNIIINEFQKTLVLARLKISPSDHSNLAFYYSIEAYLHEPCLSNVFTCGNQNPEIAKLTKQSMKSICQCTKSCLNALDEYNKLSKLEVALVPLIYASRVIYTAGMLLRLRFLIISLPSHIEKDLVPQKVITSIQAVSKLVERASMDFPFNNFLKKVRLLLQLFVQTYATQVQELLRKNGVTPENFKPINAATKELSEMVRVSKMFNNEHSSQILVNGDNQTSVPLNILSYAATYRRESSIEANKIPRDSSDVKISGSGSYPNYPVPGASNVNTGNNDNPPSLPSAIPLNPQQSSDSQSLPQPTLQHRNLYSTILPPPFFNGNIPNPTYSQPEFNQFHGPYPNQRPSVPTLPEHSILSVTDEFWADLLSSDADKINFTNNNFNPQATEDAFLMN